MKISKVISGGQTGADQAGLFAARESNIATGGWAPKGWRTDDGSSPWLADYGLEEHSSSAYPPRTRTNVSQSDLTLIFGNSSSPGCTLTKRCCNELNKPFELIKHFSGSEMDKIILRLDSLPDNLTINIAGNREKSLPGIGEKTKMFLKMLFDRAQSI